MGNVQPGIITVDVHGMNRYQAKIKVDSVLRRADSSVYQVLVIHGYHGGDSLREMVRGEYINHPRVLRIANQSDGTTALILRPFY